jgi:hypothetical protein
VRGYHYNKKYHFFDRPLGYLEKLASEDEFLYADFEKVHIAVRGSAFTAIHPHEVNGININAKLRKVTDVGENDKVFSSRVDDDLVLAFSIPTVFEKEAHAWFSDATFGHIIAPLIRCFLDYSREVESHVLLINSSTGMAEIIVCEQGKLLYANHFRITTSEDILYFALAAIQNLKLNNEQLRVKCTGPQSTETGSVLQKYFPFVQPFTFGDMHRPEFPQTDAADLICLSRCAS